MNKLGKFSLILSLLCFLITLGLKLSLDGLPAVEVGFGFGLFFLAVALLLNFKSLIAIVKSESVHFVGKSLTILLLTVVLLLLTNFIVFKKNWVADLTSNKIHSLSNLSQALVKALPEDVTFYYFHVDNDRVRGFEPQVQASLKPFIDLSDKVKFQSHSVFKRPDLAQKFKVGDEESTLFAEYKGRMQRVEGLDEKAITNALLKLTKPAKKVYFIEGHDERRLDDQSTFGLEGIETQMERLHYKVDRWNDLPNLPEDAAMLVMVGPRLPLKDAEISALKKYMDNGGSLLLAADPGEEHNLNSLIADYGIRFKKDFVFSESAQAGQSKLLVLTHKGDAQHEIAEKLEEGKNPILFMASSLDISPSEENRVQPVLQYLPGDVSRADVSETSPVVDDQQKVASAISEGSEDKPFRLAVVGDSDFLTNQFFTQPGNFDFIFSIVSYLSKDEDLLKMRAPVAETTYLILSQTQLNLYFLFFILPLSLIFFVVALFFKLRRFF